MKPQIAVIGGGIIGVGSALKLITSIPNVDITIIAEEWSPNTTGDGSAGFIYPYLAGKAEDKVIQWFKETCEFLGNYCLSYDGGKAGIGIVSTYMLFEDRSPDIPYFAKELLRVHQLSEKEMRLFPDKYKSGLLLTTYFAECTKLIPLMMDQFKTKGGKMINKRVNDIKELLGNYDIVINCTGLQSAKLVNDEKVHPIRGQVIRVIAPWIKHGVMAGDSYILPNSDVIILGGTKQIGDWNKQLNEDDRKKIIDGCTSIFPSLKSAQIVKEWVGLRPAREEPRIELETVEENGNKLHVIHNYGHGGSGVTLFWGCANDVLKLVENTLKEQSFNYLTVSRL